MKSRRLMRLVLLIGVGVLIVAVVPYALIRQCDSMNEVPQVETYPNSTRVSQEVQDRSRTRTASIIYLSPDQTETVIDYFDGIIGCNRSDDGLRATCNDSRGTVDGRDGVYSVYINPDEETQGTLITIEIIWGGCTWELELEESL